MLVWVVIILVRLSVRVREVRNVLFFDSDCGGWVCFVKVLKIMMLRLDVVLCVVRVFECFSWYCFEDMLWS